MPRLARLVIPNIPYHITQRGNRKQNVFFSDKDRKRYIELLIRYSSIYNFDIQAYCLMSNHVHIIGIPRNAESMPRTIQLVHTRHAQAVNREHRWQGHLWQSRYFATTLDDDHLWLAIRYVEQNPMRAGVVERAGDYIWSSAAFHCGVRKNDPVIKQDARLRQMFVNWSEALTEVPDTEALDLLRRRTRTGIPCGDEGFMKRMSEKTGVKYVDRKWGRPSKPDK